MDILKGLFLVMVFRMGSSEIRMMDSDEKQCNFRCNLSRGEFCLGRQCVQCSYCPENPYDLDQRGILYVYRPCYRNGFCPKICSSTMGLGSNPRANETLCQKLRKPKVTIPLTTQPQPVSTTEYETTSSSPKDTMTSGRTHSSTSQVVPSLTPNGGFSDVYVKVSVVGSISLALVFLCLSCKLCRKVKCWKKLWINSTEETKISVRKYKQLQIQLDPQSKTATVKGLQSLNCNALQLCSCFPNPRYPHQKWINTYGLDEYQLEGVLIPHQMYTVKAGRVTTRGEFECIAEGLIKTEEFVNVTLSDACSTTLEDIFGNLPLRRSLKEELKSSPERDMTEIIGTALELTGKECKDFKSYRCLGLLYDETLTANDVLDDSIHPMMEGLAQSNEAKDFVIKIVKSQTDRDMYCRKCLEVMHRMCNVDDVREVVSENSALMVGSSAV
ncbi:uncharacterized protein LOC117293402 [Asterias rubens]|uniref:uncharacterized protein LOC117293402 n=1 Tax=Asterias rubens TaxID=7604 RepID=UPI0014553D23|nr:uncharacterized protein LOC117293402 [Asterias rubens]